MRTKKIRSEMQQGVSWSPDRNASTPPITPSVYISDSNTFILLLLLFLLLRPEMDDAIYAEHISGSADAETNQGGVRWDGAS